MDLCEGRCDQIILKTAGRKRYVDGGVESVWFVILTAGFESHAFTYFFSFCFSNLPSVTYNTCDIDYW